VRESGRVKGVLEGRGYLDKGLSGLVGGLEVDGCRLSWFGSGGSVDRGHFGGSLMRNGGEEEEGERGGGRRTGGEEGVEKALRRRNPAAQVCEKRRRGRSEVREKGKSGRERMVPAQPGHCVRRSATAIPAD
jgi:hypothetical protein